MTATTRHAVIATSTSANDAVDVAGNRHKFSNSLLENLKYRESEPRLSFAARARVFWLDVVGCPTKQARRNQFCECKDKEYGNSLLSPE
jgi:hypothetical protein